MFFFWGGGGGRFDPQKTKRNVQRPWVCSPYIVWHNVPFYLDPQRKKNSKAYNRPNWSVMMTCSLDHPRLIGSSPPPKGVSSSSYTKSVDFHLAMPFPFFWESRLKRGFLLKNKQTNKQTNKNKKTKENQKQTQTKEKKAPNKTKTKQNMDSSRIKAITNLHSRVTTKNSREILDSAISQKV